MTKRWFFRAAGGLLLLALGWRIVMLVLASGQTPASRSAQAPVAVQVEAVRREGIRDIRELTGTIFPAYQYVVAPKVAGRIMDIGVRIGDWVEADQVVARLDDAEFQQALLEAQANLRIAQANLAEARSQFALAEQELARVRSLQEKGISSSAELDAAATSFDALESRINLAEAQVQQRQAALTSARIRLGYTVLHASKPGYVGERFVDPGSMLAPNAAVVSIIGIDTVIVRTTVIERIYGQVQAGQPATITVDAFPEQRFAGQVARLAPELREASRVARMEVEVPNAGQQLKPGMFSRVELVLMEKESAQIVPAPALVHRQGVRGVFAVDEGEDTARFIPVTVGVETAERIEIITPHIAGKVVTLGHHLLQDGTPVLLPDSR